MVEDNYLIATEIADSLSAANAVVLGPCSTLEEAGTQIGYSQLAMLDIDIRGRSSFPLADQLIRLDVPYIFFTGYERMHLPERFAAIDVVTKMQSTKAAIQQLEIASRDAGTGDIVALVPILRNRARSLLSDRLAADRLVERTLQLAIDDPRAWPGRHEQALWLNGLMDQAMMTGRRQILN
ncbi:MAG: hypothetical protein EOP02_08695 [Proteobacteria bacterium]|nr:MAG: hypothetical protein EOP02_08695 [Pseudomonadota bacterium]